MSSCYDEPDDLSDSRYEPNDSTFECRCVSCRSKPTVYVRRDRGSQIWARVRIHPSREWDGKWAAWAASRFDVGTDVLIVSGRDFGSAYTYRVISMNPPPPAPYKKAVYL